MFAQLITGYTDNLARLRDFVDVLDVFLERESKETFRANAADLLPVLLAIHKLDPTKAPLPNTETLKSIEERVGKNYKIDIEKKGPSKVATIKVRSSKAKDLDIAIKSVGKAEGRTELLFQSSLTTLVGSMEWFLAQLLHIYFEKFPNAAGSSEKFFSLEELKALGSIDEARKYLIESKVEDILRGSLSDWIKFLKERVHLSMGYLDEHFGQLTEMFQRRNIFVHNGGVINSIYMSKVPPEIRKNMKVGEHLHVTREYLDNAIDRAELTFVLIASELWKQLNPKDEDRASCLIDVIFDHLISKRWTVAQGLSYFVMQDKLMPELERTIGQLNYWQSMKWQGKWQDIKDEINKADYSAKDDFLQLGFYALTDHEEFFKILPKALKGKSLTPDQLENWPIFTDVRCDKRCEKYLEKK